MSALILQHLAALEATMRLGIAQIEALRHAVDTPAIPTARVVLPDRCDGVDSARCALRDGEWSTHGRSFAHPSFVKCTGCNHSCEGGPEG